MSPKMEAAIARREQRLQDVLTAAGPDGLAVRRESGRSGAVGIVHRNTYPAPAAPWRYTWLDDEGPAGHSEHQTQEEALEAMAEDATTPLEILGVEQIG